MSEFNEHVQRLMQEIYRDTTVLICGVTTEPLSNSSRSKITVRFHAGEDIHEADSDFADDADPTEPACILANFIQDEVVEFLQRGIPVPPCGCTRNTLRISGRTAQEESCLRARTASGPD